MKWPIDPFDGEPVSELSVLQGLVVKSGYSSSQKIRLLRALNELLPPVTGIGYALLVKDD